MKILHVGNIASVGLNLCRELKKRGIEADLISKDKVTSSYQGNGVYCVKNAFDEFRLCGIDLNQYDLFHDHYLINWGSLGLSVKKPKKPILLHCHGSDTRPKTALQKYIQRRVAALGKFLIYSTPDLLKNIEWFRGRKIYLPNPVAIVDKTSAVKRYDKRILIFTTLYKVKKTEDIFTLIKDLDFEFDMFDIGPDRSFYKRRAPRNVRLIKPIHKDQISEMLARYQLVIGGSQDGTIRMCELEAMAQGIPTLFPFQYNDFYPESLPMPDDWKQNMSDYFGDFTLGEQQRQWVEVYHSPSVVVDQLVKIYSRIK